MKTSLMTGASALAVVFALSGGAKAQTLIDDIGVLAGGIGDLVGSVEVEDIADLDVSGLLDIGLDLDGIGAGDGGIYQNTAFNIAPNLATTAVVGAPLDVATIGALGDVAAAAAGAISPGTGSGAIAIDLGIGDLAATLGGDVNVQGDISTTAVGLLANQGIQTSNATSNIFRDDSTLGFDGGSVDFTDEATQAAALAGSAASNSAARFTSLEVDGPTLDITTDIASDITSGPLEDIYANNLAFNLAPMVATTVVAGTNVATRGISTTAVGVLANQSISVGLDGAALTSALTGNFAASGLTEE